MKRTLVTRIATAAAIALMALASVGTAGAAQTSSHYFGVQCLSNGMQTTMASTIPGSYYAVYLQKYLPPNWVGVGYATNWVKADDYASVYQNPIGMPITFQSRASFRSEPGSYFAWALFASPNGQGGYSYQWVAADKSCTIQGSVFAKAGKNVKRVAKPSTLPRKAPAGVTAKR
jgi:hypothetical protein